MPIVFKYNFGFVAEECFEPWHIINLKKLSMLWRLIKLSRPFQGYWHHFAGGAKLLG